MDIEEVKVEEIDSTQSNLYDPARNTVILDRKLRDYPELRKEILSHELKHAEINQKSSSKLEEMILHLIHDIKTDFKRMTGRLENPEQEEKYHQTEIARPQMRNMHISVANILRNLTVFTMYAAFLPFLALKNYIEDKREK